MKLFRRLIAVAAVMLLLGCSGTTLTPASSPSPSARAELPPAWVQDEAAWQALVAGDAHPRLCRWVLTSPARAASLAGRATSYLRTFPGASGRVYVVVLEGRFRPDAGRAGTANRLYLIVQPEQHYYLAVGATTAPLHLARLGRLRTFVPQLPVSSGIWGHTQFSGGPFPGGPFAIPDARVAVRRGAHSRQVKQLLTRVRSDANGFFSLSLPPGIYTLRLSASGGAWGFHPPETVKVVAGQVVAAGVYGTGP